MKKLNSLLGVFMVAAVALLSSCGGEDPVVVVAKPTVTLASSTGTGEVGKISSYTYTAKAEAGVAKLVITKDGVEITSKSAFTTTEKNGFTYTDSYTPVAADAGKDVVFSIKITDAKNATATADFKLTVKAVVVTTPITTYSAKLLGGQSNTNPSFFSVSTGLTYSSADAKTNASKIDFVYFYGTTNKATIAAPSDADAKTAHATLTSLADWTTHNSTDLKISTMTAAQFDALTDGKAVETAYDNGTYFRDPAEPTKDVKTKVNGLAVGNVRAFMTAAGKKGLFKVVEIGGSDADGGSSRTIKIDVKIPQ